MIGLEFFGGEKHLIKKQFDYSAEDLTVPPKMAEHIKVNGQDCDLRDPNFVKLFSAKIKDYREQFNNGTLKEYDGKSTEMWKGGRSELSADEIRLKLAEDYHLGKHSLSWKAQQIEANRIASIKSAELKAKGF